jgi:methionine-rich copper-binding protein CopC
VGTARAHLIRLVAALAAGLVWAAPAGADAALTKADPAPSSAVPTAPTQIVLTFDQAVQPAPGIDVSRGGAGSVVAGKPYVQKGKGNVIVIPLQHGLGAGPYAVSWSAAAVADGSLVSGAYVFSVGSGLPSTAVPSSAQSSGGTPAARTTGRVLFVAGLLVALVAVVILRRRPRVAALAGGCALIVAAVGAVLWIVSKPGKSTPVVAQPATSRTVVYAGEDDDLAVALALTPKADNTVRVRATVLGFNGPAKGLNLGFAVDARRASARPCGPGCYSASLHLTDRPRDVAVTIARKRHPTATLHFAGPSKWPAPDALQIVRQAEQEISGLSTLVVHSRLASDAHHEVTTVYKMVAPDRLEYRNGDGSGSVIIGTHRWDRQGAHGRWVKSQQLPPISQPAPFWTPNIVDAHVLRTDTVDGHPVWVVSFLDRSTPAWFTAWVDQSSYRTRRLEMVAVAHFMHDRDGPFNAPLSIQPPGA